MSQEQQAEQCTCKVGTLSLHCTQSLLPLLSLHTQTLSSLVHQPLRQRLLPLHERGRVLQERLPPAFMPGGAGHFAQPDCTELVAASIRHCRSMISWLSRCPQAISKPAPQPHPDPGEVHKQAVPDQEPRVILPVGWELPRQAPKALSQVCTAETRRLDGLCMGLDMFASNPPEAARAAAGLQSMEIRLASAKSAVQAWLQASGPSQGGRLPLSPHQLSQMEPNGALALYEGLLVAEMGWAALSFVPSDAALFATVSASRLLLWAGRLRLLAGSVQQCAAGQDAARMQCRVLVLQCVDSMPVQHQCMQCMHAATVLPCLGCLVKAGGAQAPSHTACSALRCNAGAMCGMYRRAILHRLFRTRWQPTNCSLPRNSRHESY